MFAKGAGIYKLSARIRREANALIAVKYAYRCRTLAQADDVANVEQCATIPGPRILVEAFDLVIGQTVLACQVGAVVVSYDSVGLVLVSKSFWKGQLEISSSQDKAWISASQRVG